jgi:thiamine biosynthesis lipoprotein
MQSATWRGVALGAPAMLTLQHPSEAEAKDAISACLAEVARLEAIFSLYRTDSALVRLNEAGVLQNAPADLRILLARALSLGAQSGGVFDPTIQPLWQFYAEHTGPGSSIDRDELGHVCDRVGWHKVRIEGTVIHFEQPGMAVTLNGIAQGYITDKVGDILRARGFEHVLVDMGEQLALGPKWDGAAWHVGIRDPESEGRVMETLSIRSGAVATSSNVSGGGFPHILNPQTGRPADEWSSITVVAPSATLADGLSTALTLLPLERWPTLLSSGVHAYVTAPRQEQGFWFPGRPGDT